MKAGKDYPTGTRTRFITYAVFAGTATGLLIALPFVLAFSFYERYFGLPEHQPFAFLPLAITLFMFIPMGFGPALVTGLLCGRKYSRIGHLSFPEVLIASVYGSVLGNFTGLVAAILLLSGERSNFLNPAGLLFIFCVPLVLSPLCAAILWRIRPRAWIGPLTADELRVWRESQGAVDQSHD